MKTSIKLSIILLFISMAMDISAQSEFTVPLSDPAKRGKLIAHLNTGSITVKGTARKDVLVHYSTEAEDKNKEKEKEKSKNGVRVNTNVNVDLNGSKNNKEMDGLRKVSGGNVDLSASEDENTVKVTSNSWNENMDLVIEVPVGFDVKMHTYNDGDLLISNVQGEVDLTNYNGGITANNIKGSVVATTYNDDIKVIFDEVKPGVPMAFSTYNGDVDITFPANVKASMKFKTDQGDIYTGFDVDIKSTGPVKKEDTKSGVYKVVINEWKKGDINGGGAEVTFKTYNGDIYVRKK
ncbi:MAG: hypothetical protein ABI844_00015 [Saprospiraceae bacterium]